MECIYIVAVAEFVYAGIFCYLYYLGLMESEKEEVDPTEKRRLEKSTFLTDRSDAVVGIDAVLNFILAVVLYCGAKKRNLKHLRKWCYIQMAIFSMLVVETFYQDIIQFNPWTFIVGNIFLAYRAAVICIVKLCMGNLFEEGAQLLPNQ